MSSDTPLYTVRRPARQASVPIRSIDYHLRLWGSLDAAQPPLVLLHGWMDVGASWQFVVDALSDAFADQRLIIAPDWRGFGHSMPATPCDSYHFVDYLADLDQLLTHYAPDRPVDLVGHSMGGNVVMSYAGARPQRIRRLVNLEGFGLPPTEPTQAPQRYARWLDEIQQLARGEMALKHYDHLDGVAQRLMKTNPRLAPHKAAWLAQHWAGQHADGRWHILGDAAHRVVSAQLYRVDETLALYAAITAPVLNVEAAGTHIQAWWKDTYTLEDYHQRLQQVNDCRSAVVQDAGHMLHHDQPQVVAGLIEEFLNEK